MSLNADNTGKFVLAPAAFGVTVGFFVGGILFGVALDAKWSHIATTLVEPQFTALYGCASAALVGWMVGLAYQHYKEKPTMNSKDSKPIN